MEGLGIGLCDFEIDFLDRVSTNYEADKVAIVQDDAFFSMMAAPQYPN